MQINGRDVKSKKIQKVNVDDLLYTLLMFVVLQVLMNFYFLIKEIKKKRVMNFFFIKGSQKKI